MRKMITGDGSFTLFNRDYNETYHSTSGAIEESVRKYVEPCRIEDGMRILDICFGLGYNCLAAIHRSRNLDIVSLEKDENVLKEIQTIRVPPAFKDDYEVIKETAERLSFEEGNLKIRIIIGDASKTIIQLKESEKFDAVFLDPFSPPKNPELWTPEFFQGIARLLKKGAVLSTFTCARKVRENLKKTGFYVKDGPCVGRRSPSTIAVYK